MNNKLNDRKYFLIFCCLSIVLVGIVYSINSIMRATNASFGGITGELTVTYKVTYYANWPDENMEENFNAYDGKKIYQVLGNMFAVPSGYEFLGWGTEPDGDVVYNEGYVINLSEEISLYAIWGLVEDSEDDNNEEIVISYGDTNIDSVVDENDYLLIDSYILDNSVLSGQGLINADVNNDGKVDNIDSDIIKQAYLGTDGYVGFLPEKPILVYELYEDNESSNVEDNNNNNNNNNNGGNTSSGNGMTGSGNSNSGNNGGNKNNVSSNNKPSVDTNKEDDKKEEESIIIEEKNKEFEFKFMDGDSIYALTKCDVLQDGTCRLVLPNTVPSKSGYSFNGWSLEGDCSKHIIKENMDVNSGATYYACYFKIEEKKEKKNYFNMWVIVFAIWYLVSVLIYRIIKKFKNNENN